MTKYATRQGKIIPLDDEQEVDAAWWHASWEAAHAFITRQAESDCESLRLRLDQAEAWLAEVKAMKKPAEEAP